MRNWKEEEEQTQMVGMGPQIMRPCPPSQSLTGNRTQRNDCLGRHRRVGLDNAAQNT